LAHRGALARRQLPAADAARTRARARTAAIPAGRIVIIDGLAPRGLDRVLERACGDFVPSR
jgi:hypothetical protein